MTQKQQQQRRKKIDPLKTRGIKYIDYKDTRLLARFVNEQGKILPSRITGISSKMQRMMTEAIKRARHLSLMPFVSEEFRP
ncbi:MAG: 30S ribosomal protein S18 [Ignavibacteria bacterium]|nr:30S ribosomal protein S18 [Ignavibacteria bacterium]